MQSLLVARQQSLNATALLSLLVEVQYPSHLCIHWEIISIFLPINLFMDLAYTIEMGRLIHMF